MRPGRRGPLSPLAERLRRLLRRRSARRKALFAGMTCHPLSRFVLTRGLALCALLLAGTAALLLRARQGGAPAPRLYDFAALFQFSALVAFGCATIGSALMEDMLRYYDRP